MDDPKPERRHLDPAGPVEPPYQVSPLHAPVAFPAAARLNRARHEEREKNKQPIRPHAESCPQEGAQALTED